MGMVALYSKWVAWQLLSSASIIQLTKRRHAVLVRFCPGPMFRHTRTQSSKSSELCQVDYWLPVGAYDFMYSLSLYGDLQCQCVRCHKKIAIFRCMPLDSKHSTSRTTRLLNSAYYSRESLELLQFFILQHSPPLLPQSPQIIIISRTLLDAHTAINKSWPEIGADNSSAPAEQIVKSFQKRKPIGDIPILKLYNIQSPNWGTRSTLFPLCIYPIPFMSPNSCRLSFGWWWFLLLLLLILGCLPIFSVVINHLY